MDPLRRSQVESALGRALTDEELVVIADLAALPPSHFAVIEQLHRRGPIEAFHYLQAVVADDDPSGLRRYVHGFDILLAEREKQTLRGLELYERELGRPLTDDEMVRGNWLESLTPAHLEVARALAEKDRQLALTYLSAVAVSTSWRDREPFLASLLGDK